MQASTAEGDGDSVADMSSCPNTGAGDGGKESTVTQESPDNWSASELHKEEEANTGESITGREASSGPEDV